MGKGVWHMNYEPWEQRALDRYLALEDGDTADYERLLDEERRAKTVLKRPDVKRYELSDLVYQQLQKERARSELMIYERQAAGREIDARTFYLGMLSIVLSMIGMTAPLIIVHVL
jgi:hypothetical protein